MSTIATVRTIWKGKSISEESMIRMLRELAFSLFLYPGESWTLKSKITAKTQSQVTSTQPASKNDAVRNNITQELRRLEDVITTVKTQKLKCYSHITNVNNLSAAILQDTTLGKRRDNRMKKKSSDNVSEQTVRSLNRDISKEDAR